MFEIDEEVKRRVLLALRASAGKAVHVEFLELASGDTLIFESHNPGITTFKRVLPTDLFGMRGSEDVTEQIAEAMASDLTWTRHLKGVKS